MTALLDGGLSPEEFILRRLERFKEEVMARLQRCSP